MSASAAVLELPRRQRSAPPAARAEIQRLHFLIPRLSWPAARRRRVIRALKARGRHGAWAPSGQVRGGWSGGGRSSPSASTSSRTECAVRIAWRSGSASVGPVRLRRLKGADREQWAILAILAVLLVRATRHVRRNRRHGDGFRRFHGRGRHQRRKNEVGDHGYRQNRAINRRRTMPYPSTADKGLEVALLHKLLTFAGLRCLSAPAVNRRIPTCHSRRRIVPRATVGHGQRRPRRIFRRIVVFLRASSVPGVVTLLSVVTLGIGGRAFDIGRLRGVGRSVLAIDRCRCAVCGPASIIEGCRYP